MKESLVKSPSNGDIQPELTIFYNQARVTAVGLEINPATIIFAYNLPCLQDMLGLW